MPSDDAAEWAWKFAPRAVKQFDGLETHRERIRALIEEDRDILDALDN